MSTTPPEHPTPEPSEAQVRAALEELLRPLEAPLSDYQRMKRALSAATATAPAPSQEGQPHAQ